MLFHCSLAEAKKNQKKYCCSCCSCLAHACFGQRTKNGGGHGNHTPSTSMYAYRESFPIPSGLACFSCSPHLFATEELRHPVNCPNYYCCCRARRFGRRFPVARLAHAAAFLCYHLRRIDASLLQLGSPYLLLPPFHFLLTALGPSLRSCRVVTELRLLSPAVTFLSVGDAIRMCFV